METKSKLSVSVTIHAPLEKVWTYWVEPEHITKWYQASEDWHAPFAESDLRVQGKFKTSMAAKDGSAGFDFEGIYTKVNNQEVIEYSLEDGREVSIRFSSDGKSTTVSESFDPETVNSPELQTQGWQAILNSFKNYVENN